MIMNSSYEYENEKEVNICLMKNHKENDVNDLTYKFNYFELSLPLLFHLIIVLMNLPCVQNSML